MPISLMRPTKRLLLFAGELGSLVLGLALASAVASYIVVANDCYNSAECPVASAVLDAGVVLTIVGFVLLRRRTRPWKLEYDAVGWALTQTERKLHPTRTKYKRITKRILVWVPSAIAAGVLFFLPVATHLVHPRRHFLKYYRVPIPWNVAVFSPPGAYSYVLAFASSSRKGRFGVTPFWDSKQLSSEMHFGSVNPDAGTFEFNARYTALRRTGAAQELRKEFRLGDVAFTCWQYVHPYRYATRVGPSSTEPLWWNVDCGTPVDVRQQNLYAWFLGREEDIPSFYRIIEGVKPVK